MNRVLVAVLSFALLAAAVDDREEDFQRAMRLYEDGKYAQATKVFADLEKGTPADLRIKYNSLACMTAEGRLEDVSNKLGADFSALGNRPDVRAKATYNLGTALLKIADEANRQGVLQTKEQELRSAVQWLQQSLLDTPPDHEAKNNLEYANKLLEKLEKQKQQQGEDQQDGQRQKEGEEQDRQKQDGKKQEEQRQQEQQKQSQQNQGKKQQQQQDSRGQPDSGDSSRRDQSREIPKEVAQNLLKAARKAELQALKMLRNAQNKDAKRKRSRGVDW